VYRVIGVRAPATITTSVGNISASFLQILGRLPLRPVRKRRFNIAHYLDSPNHESFDATLVYLAKRESISAFLTVDADFATYRIEGKRQFKILPIQRSR
jgi:predicted nucleic acid-binding protein